VRLAFAGTPEFAACALIAVHAAGHEIACVLSQPDRPAGRGMKLLASTVKLTAQQLGLPVLQPRSLRLDGRWPEDAQQARAALLAAGLDAMVVAAYGLILPDWTLKLPRLGCLNIHASLLPRWRGAAPIQRALQAGDAQTGITIMQMDAGLDTGDMLLTGVEPIAPTDTAGTLHDRLAPLGARLIVEALARLHTGGLPAQPQPGEGVSYAHKIDKAEAAIDWALDAQQIERNLRAFDPVPGAHFGFGGQPIKLWRGAVDLSGSARGQRPGTVVAVAEDALVVACGRDCLRLLELQLPGGRRVTARQFRQSPLGRRLMAGQCLDDGRTA
jgi:methionyl-tRNA formyltransferase